jgi:hypothetical protein
MFSIKLDILDNIETPNSSIQSINGTAINEVLMNICDEFYQHLEIITFSINGFDKDWKNLSIDPDLCMLMEDLPGLVHFINNEDLPEFQFGFPEQHLQRILTVKRVASGLKVSCSDWLSKSVELTEELLQPEYFKSLLKELVEKIRLVIDKLCPVAYENNIFQDWLKQTQL